MQKKEGGKKSEKLNSLSANSNLISVLLNILPVTK